MAHFPATVDVAGVVTPAGQQAAENTRKDTLETSLQTTPNDVLKLYGDGGANALGYMFTVRRNMLRLRVSFRIDAGNNYDLRVRFMKYDSGTAASYELARVAMSNTADGTQASGTYWIRQQLVSAGANPSESFVETTDAIYYIVDKAAGTVATGISQIVLCVEHEVA